MIINIENSIIINTDSLKSGIDQLLNSYFNPGQPFIFDLPNKRINMLGAKGSFKINEH